MDELKIAKGPNLFF